MTGERKESQRRRKREGKESGRRGKGEGKESERRVKRESHGVSNTYCRGIESAFRAKERAV